MNLLVPAALAFSAIIPIILLFYFMRPKRQQLVVGSTFLWQQALQEMQASRPWQRLRVTPLLLLQLLAAIVIVLILARPAIFANSVISGNTIIILQSSASMQATDVAPNRFESAKNTIADMIDAMGPSDYLSLITMARVPKVLATHSQNHSQLLRELQQANVTNEDADLQQALSLATSLAAGQNNPQVLIIGDGHVMSTNQQVTVPFPVRYQAVGTDSANAALTALSSRVIQGKLTAFAQVANFSNQSRSLPIGLYADNNLVSVQTLTLAANATGSLQWGPLKATTQTLHAHIISQDPLMVDHDAWAIVGSSMHGRALLVTKGNTFLETALRLQSNLSLYEIQPDKYSDTSTNSNNNNGNTNSAATYDLTIFDGMVPAHLPSGNVFIINPPEGKYPFGSSGTTTGVNQITTGTDSHNLLHDVDLSNIHTIRTTHQLQPQLWAESVIMAGATPLLIAGENSNQRVIVLGFDLHDSDLPLQPAYPILMHNLVDWLLPSPIPGTTQIAPGIPVTIQSWPGADHITITDPNRQLTTVGPPFPVPPYTQTNTVGLYHVTQKVQDRTLDGSFAVNLFNPRQSRLAPAHNLPVVNSSTINANSNSIPRQLREIWPEVAAFLLLVLCLEWWWFSRSYQTQKSRRRSFSVNSKVSITQKSHKPANRMEQLVADLRQEWDTNTHILKKRYKKFSHTFSRNLKRIKKHSEKGDRHGNI